MPELAIAGGRRLWSQPWPAWPAVDAATRERVLDCLGSGWWTISGPRTDRPAYEKMFADEFAEYLGARYCVPTTNGTSALVIALEALNVGAGDEVIIPGMTWVASASTVMAVNATPVIVDIDPRTLCIDPEAIRATITPRTKALSIVHLYNSICDLDAITEICRSTGIRLIEDCAQAHGAQWRRRSVGLWGDIGTFSMQQTKLLTAGEGGAAVTDDETLYRRLYQLRADGRLPVSDPRPGEMELSFTGCGTRCDGRPNLRRYRGGSRLGTVPDRFGRLAGARPHVGMGRGRAIRHGPPPAVGAGPPGRRGHRGGRGGRPQRRGGTVRSENASSGSSLV
jgi:L-glutamine:2-deoxy-scyllo-inosose/3-amino-2,3-dideoxy-scyllo-inosose aminotransferase